MESLMPDKPFHLDPEEGKNRPSMDAMVSQRDEIQRRILDRKREILNVVLAVIRANNISPEELAYAWKRRDAKILSVRDRKPPNKTGVKLPVLYRHPETHEEWTGRGKLPNWIRNSGRPREAFRLPE